MEPRRVPFTRGRGPGRGNTCPSLYVRSRTSSPTPAQAHGVGGSRNEDGSLTLVTGTTEELVAKGGWGSGFQNHVGRRVKHFKNTSYL